MVGSESCHGWSSGEDRRTENAKVEREKFDDAEVGLRSVRNRHRPYRSGQKRVDDESEETADLRRQRFRPVDHGDSKHGGDQVRQQHSR